MSQPNNKQAQQQDTNQLYPDDPFGGIREGVQNKAPLPQEVNFLHTRSDKNASQSAQHHTLGPGHNEASPGDHKHDGIQSKKLLDGVTITQSRADLGTTGALQALLNSLTALGLTNSSTP